MERITIFFLILLSIFGVAYAQTAPQVVPGVITAGNVDVTADDGSLLSERLGVGDMVYIILQPTNARKGWVRISRSPEDSLGFGWVETKNVQRFASYTSTGGSSSTPQHTTSSYGVAPNRGGEGIAVLPFGASQSGDSYGRKLFKEFSSALKGKSGLSVITNLPSGGIDLESTQALRRFLVDNGLEGVIVGKISSPFGGNRLLQLKYLGKDRTSFTIEKVKRLPVKADSRQAMKELAAVYADSLSR